MFKVKRRPTDALFRKYILIRDNYTCQRCRRQYPPDNCRGLHVSHYWGRGRENVRFDPENVVALCFGCHRIWGHGDRHPQYMSFMIKRLGYRNYELLEVRAHITKRRDDKLDKIILTCMLQLQELNNKEGGQ